MVGVPLLAKPCWLIDRSCKEPLWPVPSLNLGSLGGCGGKSRCLLRAHSVDTFSAITWMHHHALIPFFKFRLRDLYADWRNPAWTQDEEWVLRREGELSQMGIQALCRWSLPILLILIDSVGGLSMWYSSSACVSHMWGPDFNPQRHKRIKTKLILLVVISSPLFQQSPKFLPIVAWRYLIG